MNCMVDGVAKSRTRLSDFNFDFDSSVGKESTCNVGDLGSVPGLGGSPGEGKGYPLQYSGLENSMECIVHGVAKSLTGLSDFHSASGGFPHSSVGKESACNAEDPSSIPGSGRSPGEGIGYPLQYSWASLVAQLVKNPPACGRPGFDPWVGKIPWRRERLPTPVFWRREFHVLYSPWGRKESDMTERPSLSLSGYVAS